MFGLTTTKRLKKEMKALNLLAAEYGIAVVHLEHVAKDLALYARFTGFVEGVLAGLKHTSAVRSLSLIKAKYEEEFDPYLPDGSMRTPVLDDADKPIHDVGADLAAQIPQEELDRMPTDGSVTKGYDRAPEEADNG